LKFKARALPTLAPTIIREFPAMPGVSFSIRPISCRAYQEALEARAKKENVAGGAMKAVTRAAFKAGRFSPKNPPPGLREKLGPDAKITRTDIAEWLRDVEIDRLPAPEAAADSDVLQLVEGAHCDAGADLGEDDAGQPITSWSPSVGEELLKANGPEYRIPADVVEQCLGDDAPGGSSLGLGHLFRQWIFRLAGDEDAFAGASSSPNG